MTKKREDVPYSVKSDREESDAEKRMRDGFYDCATAGFFNAGRYAFQNGDLIRAASLYGRAAKARKKFDTSKKGSHFTGYLPTAQACEEEAAQIKRFEKDRKKQRGLDDSLNSASLVIITFIGLIAGLLFLSSNITGNTISNMTNSTSNIIGAVLLVIGLVAGYFWIRNK